MTLREWLVGGVWLASCVEMARFGWEAFTQTYQPFPTPTGGGNLNPKVPYTPGKPTDTGPFQVPPPNANIGTIYNNIKRHAPPGVISQISTLYNQHKNLDPGVDALTKWALKAMPKEDRLTVLQAEILYVEHGWPGGKFTHNFQLDPGSNLNPVQWFIRTVRNATRSK